MKYYLKDKTFPEKERTRINNLLLDKNALGRAYDFFVRQNIINKFFTK